MTRDELLKGITNALAHPQAWDSAGLGTVTVREAGAFARERANNIVTWLWPLIAEANPAVCTVGPDLESHEEA